MAKPLAGLAPWVATEWRRVAWSGRPQPTGARTGGASMLARGRGGEGFPRGGGFRGTGSAGVGESLGLGVATPDYSSYIRLLFRVADTVCSTRLLALS